MAQQTETKTEPKKSSMNPILVIGCGCLIVIIVGAIIISMFSGFLIKRFGSSIVQSVIENKTGIKANLNDLENGSMTFTDKKTGQTVDIGAGKLPDSFPDDIKVYPGAKVAGAISGSGNEEGVFVTFTTDDNISNVVSFYKNSLRSGNWRVESTTELGPMTTFEIAKESATGSITITGDSNKSGTNIMVTINEE